MNKNQSRYVNINEARFNCCILEPTQFPKSLTIVDDMTRFICRATVAARGYDLALTCEIIVLTAPTAVDVYQSVYSHIFRINLSEMENKKRRVSHGHFYDVCLCREAEKSVKIAHKLGRTCSKLKEYCHTPCQTFELQNAYMKCCRLLFADIYQPVYTACSIMTEFVLK